MSGDAIFLPATSSEVNVLDVSIPIFPVFGNVLTGLLLSFLT